MRKSLILACAAIVALSPLAAVAQSFPSGGVSIITTPGYTVATLPSAPIGSRAYVTDQLTTCAVAGAALTGGGSVACPVFHNATTWVGD